MLLAVAESVVFGGIVGAFFFVVAYFVSRVSREWSATWRGKAIHIVMGWNSCRILIDDAVIGEWRTLAGIGLTGKRFLETQFDMGNKSCDLQLVFKSDSQGGVSGAQLVIDGEIVHLAEAPRDNLGRAISEKLPTLKNVETVHGTPISDPRYSAAIRLFESIQAEVSDDDPVHKLLLELQTELQEHILIAQRLTQSKQDYVALGNDGGRIDLAQQETEEKIQMLLTGLQEIHLGVVQRNIAISEPLIERVQNLLHKIHADLEVESDKTSLDARKKNQRDKRPDFT